MENDGGSPVQRPGGVDFSPLEHVGESLRAVLSGSIPPNFDLTGKELRAGTRPAAETE